MNLKWISIKKAAQEDLRRGCSVNLPNNDDGKKDRVKEIRKGKKRLQHVSQAIDNQTCADCDHADHPVFL